ncbi:MAG: 30S ribosomal protein S2, partial [Patescibacteria group bacterium]
LTKKEAISIRRDITKLESSLGGIKDMTKLPGALFIVDPKDEGIARKEANKLGIPVVAICDTNCDPDGIDYLIPGNDDALRSLAYFANLFAEACLEGMGRREQALREEPQDKKQARDKSTAPRVQEVKVGGRGRAYTAKKPDEKGEDIPTAELDKYASAKVPEEETTKVEEKKE